MSQITIEHDVSPAKLDAMHVDSWATWRKEISTFKWRYAQSETCYILEGEAVITPEDGEPVTIQRGDLVQFPAGMSCTWQITEDMEKNYIFK